VSWPLEIGQQRLKPGVRSTLAEQVPGDVPRWNAENSQKGNRYVRVVLTHTTTQVKRHRRWRLHARDAQLVCDRSRRPRARSLSKSVFAGGGFHAAGDVTTMRNRYVELLGDALKIDIFAVKLVVAIPDKMHD